MNDNFIQELQDDIRDEKLANLWKKYANYIIGLALLIVLVAAFFPIYQYVMTSRAATAEVSYQQAVSLMQRGKNDEALVLFRELQTSGTGYGSLAKMQEGALLTQMALNASGDEAAKKLMAEAEDLYGAIAQQNKGDASLVGISTVLGALRAAASGENVETWREKLQPLTAPDHPWRGLALETLALFALKKGDVKEAATAYMDMTADKHISPDTVARAAMMMAQMNIPQATWAELTQKSSPQPKAP